MIVAGFGFRGEASASSLRNALSCTAAKDVEALAAPADKAEAPCFQAFAKALALPIVAVQAEALETIETTTQSPHSLDNRGTGSVAEACALAAAGPQATLITKRHISPDRMATCAIAKGLRT